MSPPRNPSPEVRVRWSVFTTCPVVGIHLTLLPGTDELLLVGRPEQSGEVVVGRLDVTNLQWHDMTMASNAFCGIVTPGAGTEVVLIGGSPERGGYPSGLQQLRVYDHASGTSAIPENVAMHDGRWYPTGILLANKKIFIIGGTDGWDLTSPPSQHVELYDPSQPAMMPTEHLLEPQHVQYADKHYYPFAWLLPTGHVFTLINRQSRFFTQDGEYVRDSAGGYLAAPTIPSEWDSGYPSTGMAVMTALSASPTSVDIIVFGGQKNGTGCGRATQEVVQSLLAARDSYRLNISWTMSDSGDVQYTFGTWQQEDMGISRVGGDATLLPNGDVVITSGVQAGCMGDVNRRTAQGDYPALWPVLYQPDAAQGQRYTILEASTIPRTYHQAVALLRDGQLVISGCDACGARVLTSDAAEFWDPPAAGERREFRLESFSTPYALDTEYRVNVTSVAGETDSSAPVLLEHGSEYTLTWAAGNPDITQLSGIALSAPSSTTHSYDSNQRVVYATIIGQGSGSVRFLMPADRNVLPPQYYLLWALVGKTYSNMAWWIRLQ